MDTGSRSIRGPLAAATTALVAVALLTWAWRHPADMTPHGPQLPPEPPPVVPEEPATLPLAREILEQKPTLSDDEQRAVARQQADAMIREIRALIFAIAADAREPHFFHVETPPVPGKNFAQMAELERLVIEEIHRAGYLFEWTPFGVMVWMPDAVDDANEAKRAMRAARE